MGAHIRPWRFRPFQGFANPDVGLALEQGAKREARFDPAQAQALAEVVVTGNLSVRPDIQRAKNFAVHLRVVSAWELEREPYDASRDTRLQEMDEYDLQVNLRRDLSARVFVFRT